MSRRSRRSLVAVVKEEEPDVKIEVKEEEDNDSLDLEKSPFDYHEEDSSDEDTEDSDEGYYNNKEPLVPFSLRRDLTPELKKWQLKIRYSDRYRTADMEYRYGLARSSAFIIGLIDCDTYYKHSDTLFCQRHSTRQWSVAPSKSGSSLKTSGGTLASSSPLAGSTTSFTALSRTSFSFDGFLKRRKRRRMKRKKMKCLSRKRKSKNTRSDKF